MQRVIYFVNGFRSVNPYIKISVLKALLSEFSSKIGLWYISKSSELD